MLILTNEDIEALIDMPATMVALEAVYRDFGLGDAVDIPRQDGLVTNPRPGAIHAFKTMSGSWPRAGITALRLNSDIVHWPVVAGSPRRVKMPVSTGQRFNGMVLLFSTDTGQLLCTFNDGVVQNTRVGGTSGVAAKYMAREDARILGLLGTGWQAQAQVEAMCGVRRLELVKVYSPTAANRERFAATFTRKLGIKIRAVATADEAADGADILVSATNSMVPTIKPEYLRPGMHITSVRGNEIPLELLGKVDRLVVHTHVPVGVFAARGWPSEVPEFSIGDYSRQDMGANAHGKAAELKDVVAGTVQGRQRPDEITCFYNYKGLGLQFAAIGSLIYEAARKRGLGLTVEDNYFTQSVHP